MYFLGIFSVVLSYLKKNLFKQKLPRGCSKQVGGGGGGPGGGSGSLLDSVQKEPAFF